jgi:hypothetical protein
MRRILRVVVIGMLALMVVVGALFSWYRMRGPSASERAALDRLERVQRPAQGRNAFPLLWFLARDIPDSAIDTQMAADVETVRKRLATADVVLYIGPSGTVLPQPDWDDPALCTRRETECLALVAAKRDQTRAALAKYERMLARAQSLEQADFLWTDFPLDFRAPDAGITASVQAQNLWLSSLALQFLDGDHRGALDGVCRNAKTWRRLRASTNSMISDFVSIVLVDRSVRLFADMLAAAPEQPTPTSCSEAFRPIETADVDRCAELGAEVEMGRNMFQPALLAQQSYWERISVAATVDVEQTAALKAEQFSLYCGETAQRRMLADQHVDPSPLQHSIWRMECIANVAGCVLGEMGVDAYVPYDARILDYLAHVRLAATLLWLHQPPLTAASLGDKVAQLPAELRSAHHPSGIDTGKRVLFVKNWDPHREEMFELPLPEAYFKP